MPEPIKDKTGFHCVLRPDGYKGKKIVKHFHWKRHKDPRAACQMFIDQQIGGAVPSLESATIDQLFAEYLRNRELMKKKKDSTLVADRSRAKQLCAYFKGKQIRQIGIDEVRKFQRYFFEGGTWYRNGQVRDVGDRTNTWMKYICLLSVVFKFAMAHGKCDTNPAASPEFRYTIERKRPKRIFSGPEVIMLLAKVDELNRPDYSLLFRVLAFTGCRLTEARNLLWREINFDLGAITFINRKNRRFLALPIQRSLRPSLDEAASTPHDADDYVIKPHLTSGRYNRIWHQVQIAAGIKPPYARIHDIRHTLGTLLHWQQKVPLRHVGDWLGQSDLKSTEIYASVLPAHLAEIADKDFPY